MGSLQGIERRRSVSTSTASQKLGVLLTGLISAGVIHPPLELERRYLDQRLKARIDPDGSVTCMGRVFSTLSSAASYARSTCTGPMEPDSHRLSSNGWTFWQYRNTEGQLESMRSLRRRFLRS